MISLAFFLVIIYRYCNEEKGIVYDYHSVSEK